MRKSRYKELAITIAKAIEDEILPPGSRLPTHRLFAEQHGVALATATRAYRELENRGLIVGEAGRGMFVRDPGLPITLGMEHTENKGLLDLVFNMPGDEADPQILRDALKRLAMAGDLEAMQRYQPHGGRVHERKVIAAHLDQPLGKIEYENLLITSGAQHGLAITTLGLFQRGDAIGIDPLTYPGFKSIAALHGLKLVPIENSGNVMNPDSLERQCRAQKLRAIYMMPTVHNPLGSVMGETTRLRIVDIAHRHDVLLIEDSSYAFLEPNPPPSLIVLAPERTIHIGGFSKNLATGLRLGYLVAPQPYIDKLLQAIRATTWNAPALISALVIGWIEDGTLAKSEVNRRRGGAWRQHLCRQILQNIHYSSHNNAGFAWLELQDGQRAEPIISRLATKGIAVCSAKPFAVGDSAPQAIRLAFGGIPKHELRNIFEKVRDEIVS